MAPVSAGERIQALDVVRGFALIGIFLMNIEFLNRPIADLGLGLPPTLQGADWWAGYLIYVLVQGKFWTMFSLLFGMGFAVMLTRSERSGRSFLVPYLRRIAALAVFGAAHHIFLWAGDILFSYAVGATCLLLLLWARWWAVLGLIVIAAVVSALVPGLQSVWAIAFGLTMVMFASWYLNSEARVRRSSLPWHSLLFAVAGAAMLVVAILAGISPDRGPPAEARWPLLIGSGFLWLLGWLSWRYKDPVEHRPRRLGPTMYLLPMCVMLAFGLLQIYGPEPPKASEAQVATAMVEAKAARAAEKAGKPLPDEKENGEAAARKSPTERSALREANRRLNRAEREEEMAVDLRSITTGSYGELVALRAKQFAGHMPDEFGFSTLIVGMFLLGYWFVRTGIMERPQEHLPLFRQLALVGIPFGVGLGIAASFLASHSSPGLDRDPYQAAMAIMMIGNLPACLGYVSLIVLTLYSSGPFSRVRVLAPLGRMALTNYLTHSLVSSLYFYGYAGGHYGMPRATQVGFVFFVIALQVVFSHWWLSKFNYGPMEWLWRAITYWTVPAMRRTAA
jgi:uncharacterized membrane protein YeiB